jgi:hypothetical protein
VWRNLSGARYWNDFHVTAGPIEESARDVRERSRDSSAGDVIDAVDTTLVASRNHESASAEIEVESSVKLAFRFADEIPAGDAGIGCTIRDELWNVLGSDEDCLELSTQ